MRKSLISVVIPVLNAEEFIEECVRSVLSQELNEYDLKIHVFDNNSSDKTLSILQGINDSRIMVHSSVDTVSAPSNWNRVSELAEGGFVKLLPADDTLLPGCLLDQVKALEANPLASMVCSSRLIVSQEGNPLPRFLGKLGHLGFMDGAVVSRALVRSGRSLGEPGAMLFRGISFRETLPWNGRAGYAIDMEFYFRILERGGFVGLGDFHATFRLSVNSWSNKVAAEQFSDVYRLYLARFIELGSNPSILQKLSLMTRLKTLTLIRLSLNQYARVIDEITKSLSRGKV